MKQFERTERLIGAEAQKKLNNCHVAVFGLGGVGGFAVEALARAGIGELTLVDFDTVDETNINRQLFALRSTVGQPKTEVAKARVSDINPEVIVNALQMRFDANTQYMSDFAQFDYVIDAVDTVTSKLLLAQICAEKNIPLISCMGTGNKLNPTLFKVADISETKVCPLAKVMRRELKKRGITHLKVVYSEEEPKKPIESESDNLRAEINISKTDSDSEIADIYDKAQKENTLVENKKAADLNNGRKIPPASISFVPPVAGMILAGEVIKDLIKK